MADDLFILQRDSEIEARQNRKKFAWLGLACIILSFFSIPAALGGTVGLLAAVDRNRIAEFIRVQFRLEAWKWGPRIVSIRHAVTFCWLRSIWRMHLRLCPERGLDEWFPYITFYAMSALIILQVPYAAMSFGTVVLVAGIGTSGRTLYREGFVWASLALMYAVVAMLALIFGGQLGVDSVSTALCALASALTAATMVLLMSRRVLRLVTVSLGYDARVRDGFRRFRAGKTKEEKIRWRIKRILLALLVAVSFGFAWQTGVALLAATLGYVWGEEIVDILVVDVWDGSETAFASAEPHVGLSNRSRHA